VGENRIQKQNNFAHGFFHFTFFILLPDSSPESLIGIVYFWREDAVSKNIIQKQNNFSYQLFLV